MAVFYSPFARTAADNQEVKLIEVPVPEIGDDEVLIKVGTFGIGIHDRYFIPEGVNFPYTIGSEGAGVISKLGDKVEGFSKGDQVIYTTALQPQGGTWAEFAVAKAGTLIKKPSELSVERGVAIPIAGKTALENLRELALQEGDFLFIAGASGAIGTCLIQLAKAKGVQIVASASAKNHEYMKSLGADKTVDYNDDNWINEVNNWSNNGVTAALAIQPNTGNDSIKVVKKNGLLITVSGDSTHVKPERGITVRQMAHQFFTTKELSELVEDIAKGKIRVIIEKEYPFEEALTALEKTETRHARGKLVVKID